MIGLALGLVQAAAAQTILGNAPVRMAGVAGGLQQTALQVGGALGTAVLGAVLSGRVTASLLGKLTGSGVTRSCRPSSLLPAPRLRRAGYPADQAR